MTKKYLDDKQTRDFIRAGEKGELVSVPNLQIMKSKLSQAAKAMVRARKNKSVTIRISEEELYKLKVKANRKRIPYQTLLTALIHQYNDNKINVSVL
ncbi:MAG: CopG family antitoxin [Patescibacteria group bacterium]